MGGGKLLMYYQTFTNLSPILASNPKVTHIHLSSIHFGTNENQTPYIHLNNDSPYCKKFDLSLIHI